MKMFLYKSLFIFFLIFVTFHLTFGYAIKSIKNEVFNTLSKDKVLFLKDKIRDEIAVANDKDNILYPDDAKLIGKFIKKLISEIN